MSTWRTNVQPVTWDRDVSAVEPRQQPWRGPPWLPHQSRTYPITTILTIPAPVPSTSTGPDEAPITTGAVPSETLLIFTSISTTSPFSSSIASSYPDTDVADIMSTDIPASAVPTTADAVTNETSPGSEDGVAGNKNLVIILSTVLSAVAVILIAGGLYLCWRYRQRRRLFFSRGITPIDDDEIATWKVPRDEKNGYPAGDTDVEGDAAFNKETGGPSHGRKVSTTSIKKPPSVIVYNSVQGYRQSIDEPTPRRSFTQHPVYGKMSLDKGLPQTPIQARAPNARAGLTDESVPGDDPFIPSPKRQTSRLSKIPPSSASHRRHHGRTRSSRSSTRSFGDYRYGASDVELSPRHSHDQFRSRHHHYNLNHSRVYSSSSIPPRLSLGEEAHYNGGSPGRPLFKEDEIGRAIG
ncbi:hypothetical protein QC763_112020 [Podospora pseudopauciseta]|uniref:Uncharacterized protein n=1 Tax=Podospora pseudopauciseta TaxID=2093780 RepID=A0ABR0HZW2_9PEZI|nr:hypothetical protein QC763_112020 [Podospora pseudopauciseta]